METYLHYKTKIFFPFKLQNFSDFKYTKFLGGQHFLIRLEVYRIIKFLYM